MHSHSSMRTGTTPGARASSASSRGGASLMRKRHARRCVRAHALPEWLRGALDFESWAPRSSRAWRLNQYEPETMLKADADDIKDAEGMALLSDRISQLRDGGPAASTSGSGGGGGAAVLDAPFPGGSSASAAGDLPEPSAFTAAGDAELLASLSQRVSALASQDDEAAAEVLSIPAAATAAPELTGQEMWDLMLVKYGRSYDMSFVKRDLPGMPSIVCLNIMWLHLEQRSFKMSHQQYLQKLDAVAALVNRLSQTAKVRAFLQAPAKAHKGLPRRPVVGTAVSIRLDLDQAVVNEWFGTSGM